MGLASGFEPLSCQRSVAQQSRQKYSRNILRQSRDIKILARVIPVIDPVHHAEEQEGRHPQINPFDFVSRRDFIKYVSHYVNVLPLLAVDLLEEVPADRVRLVREDLHFIHVVYKIVEVILDQELEPVNRVVHTRKEPSAILQKRAEAIVLNQKKELFLAAEVIVETGETHLRGPGDVSDARGVVA